MLGEQNKPPLKGAAYLYATIYSNPPLHLLLGYFWVEAITLKASVVFALTSG